MASALAARTEQVPIVISLVVLPLYNPIRLAEEMCVLDHLSSGRLSYIGGIGYRSVEYEMYGVDFHTRGSDAERYLSLLLRAKTGLPFEYEGRRIHVTPGPYTPGGPKMAWGGGSEAAARRAGRYGLDFVAFRNSEKLRVAFNEESRAHGHQPRACILPRIDQPGTIFVAENLDRAWEEVGPYLLYDVRSNAEWNQGSRGTVSISFAQTIDELRKENATHRIMVVEEAIEYGRAHGALSLHPLIGGLPPETAWRYLKNVVEKVEPVLAA
jgi:alkanesulfonate monooxygenase SsuD/methylene tetrahydromethanopterin reductase-like flavin-dependent oxidoreductase (luciferase family)